MKIEEGGFYKTRDGRKVGPVRATDNNYWPMKCGQTWWRANGESCEGSMAFMRPENDIVSDWIDPPVRMRPEIVDGTYGKISVSGATRKRVGIKISRNSDLWTDFTAPELTAAIATLTTIRDALDEVA